MQNPKWLYMHFKLKFNAFRIVDAYYTEMIEYARNYSKH